VLDLLDDQGLNRSSTVAAGMLFQPELPVRRPSPPTIATSARRRKRDKALAIEVYARQARNTKAETKACEIWLRAERRCGQLLRERDKAKGSAQPGVGRKGARGMQSQPATALSDLGISKTQSSRWQKLAAIPDLEFERTFAGGAGQKPSTTGLIATHAPLKPAPPTTKVDDRASLPPGQAAKFLAVAGQDDAPDPNGQAVHWRAITFQSGIPAEYQSGTKGPWSGQRQEIDGVKAVATACMADEYIERLVRTKTVGSSAGANSHGDLRAAAERMQGRVRRARRYVVDDEVAAAASRLATGDPEILAQLLPGARTPFHTVWLEWSHNAQLDGTGFQYDFDGSRPADRIAALIRQMPEKLSRFTVELILRQFEPNNRTANKQGFVFSVIPIGFAYDTDHDLPDEARRDQLEMATNFGITQTALASGLPGLAQVGSIARMQPRDPEFYDPTLTPDFRICLPISHLWAARKSLALRMRGSEGFLLVTDWTSEQAREGAVER
jgi:hypothetical protein